MKEDHEPSRTHNLDGPRPWLGWRVFFQTFVFFLQQFSEKSRQSMPCLRKWCWLLVMAVTINLLISPNYVALSCCEWRSYIVPLPQSLTQISLVVHARLDDSHSTPSAHIQCPSHPSIFHSSSFLLAINLNVSCHVLACLLFSDGWSAVVRYCSQFVFTFEIVNGRLLCSCLKGPSSTLPCCYCLCCGRRCRILLTTVVAISSLVLSPNIPIHFQCYMKEGQGAHISSSFESKRAQKRAMDSTLCTQLLHLSMIEFSYFVLLSCSVNGVERHSMSKAWSLVKSRIRHCQVFTTWTQGHRQ